jgi:hypothetical protein
MKIKTISKETKARDSNTIRALKSSNGRRSVYDKKMRSLTSLWQRTRKDSVIIWIYTVLPP